MSEGDNLTPICAVTGTAWKRRARWALESVQGLAPNLKTLLWPYTRGRAGKRFNALLEAETPWVLYMDADVLATGDVRIIRDMVAASGKPFAARWDPMQAEQMPEWHEERYRAMMAAAGLPMRKIVWNGVMLMTRDLAQDVVPRLSDWIQWYLRYWRKNERVFDRRHPKQDQFGWTLALADAGIGDGETFWLTPNEVSFHSHQGELGLIHHFNGQVYARLERQGRLWAAIEERRKVGAEIAGRE